MQAADGKFYKTNVAKTQQLFKLFQSASQIFLIHKIYEYPLSIHNRAYFYYFIGGIYVIGANIHFATW
jgi:hypothetical protein